jgi:diaminopimelate decarboxylase
VNSLQHLDLVTSIGFQGPEVIFTASAMDERTMRMVHDRGALVNLDSPGQIREWLRLFPDGRAGLRCNIGELVKPQGTRAGYFLGRESRLGLTMDQVRALVGAPWVEGLHLYVGTDILDLTHFRECYEHLAKLARLFPSLRYLDLGGGFGVGRTEAEQFDIETYGRMVTDLMRNVSTQAKRSVRLVLEPGRIIGATAGWFVCRVTDVKPREGRMLVGVNASVAQFPRPLFYPDSAFHPAVLLPADGRAAAALEVPTDVFGCSTYSRDYLARGVELPAAEPGDLVVFGQAGAYCASAHTAFLGFPRPEEHFI